MPKLLSTFDADGNPVGRDSTPTEEANQVALIGKARAALSSNSSFLSLPDPGAPGGTNTIYLAIVSPNNAQVVAQVRALTQQINALVAQDIALTRQVNTIIRYLLGEVTTIADT